MLNRWKTNKYFNAIALLASGSFLGQIIGFVGSILMTRLYSKAEIGIMTTVISVSGMFASVINGRFDYAIVKERDKEKLFPLVALSLIIGIFFSFAVALGSIFYFHGLKDSGSAILLSSFVFLILIITSFTNVFRSYNNRVADFKTMTWVIVIRRAAEELSMVLFGVLHLRALGLLFSRIIGQFFGMRQEIKNIKKHFKEVLSSSKESIFIAFKDHKRQLYFSAPAALMNSASYSLISLFIGNLFGLEKLGLYAISFAVLGLPLSVISGNVSKVYFGEASQEFSETGRFRNSTKKTVLIVAPIAVFIWAAMYFLMPVIIPWIYGSNYAESGTFIKILSSMFAIRFVSSSLNTGLVVANKQNVEVVIQILFLLAITILTIFCKNSEKNVSFYLVGISISYSLIYLINFYYIILLSKKQLK